MGYYFVGVIYLFSPLQSYPYTLFTVRTIYPF